VAWQLDDTKPAVKGPGYELVGCWVFDENLGQYVNIAGVDGQTLTPGGDIAFVAGGHYGDGLELTEEGGSGAWLVNDAADPAMPFTEDYTSRVIILNELKARQGSSGRLKFYSSVRQAQAGDPEFYPSGITVRSEVGSGNPDYHFRFGGTFSEATVPALSAPRTQALLGDASARASNIGDGTCRLFQDSQVSTNVAHASTSVSGHYGYAGVGINSSSSTPPITIWGHLVYNGRLPDQYFADIYNDPVEALMVTGPGAPGQVQGVTATRQAGDVSTLIEWQLEPDAETHEVQQQLVGETDQWQVVAAAVVGTSFTDNHSGGARREYRVRAENATDIGPWSDVAQETLLPVELSGQVDGVGSVSGSPEVSRLLSGQVDGVGAVSGSPEVSSSLSGRMDGVGAVSGSPEVSRLLSGQVAGEGSVAGSPEVSRLLSGQVDGVGSVEGEPVVEIVEPPAVPNNLGVTYVNETRNTVAWDEVAGATSYVLEYRDVTGSGAWTELAIISQFSYTDDKPNTNRRAYRVSARNAVGDSPTTAQEFELRPYRLRFDNGCGVVSSGFWLDTTKPHKIEYSANRTDSFTSGKDVWYSNNGASAYGRDRATTNVESVFRCQRSGVGASASLVIPRGVSHDYIEDVQTPGELILTISGIGSETILVGSVDSGAGIGIGNSSLTSAYIGVIQNFKFYDETGELKHWWPIDDNALDGGQIDDLIGGAHGTLTLGFGEWFNPDAPDVPTGLSVVADSDEQNTISWNASAGATGYDLRARIYQSGDDWSLLVDNQNVLSHAHPHGAGERWEYQVRAWNALWPSNWSDSVIEPPVINLSGQVDGIGTVEGLPDVSKLLSGRVDGAGAVSGSLGVSRLLSGRVDGAGTVEGEPAVDTTILLSGRVDGAGSVAGLPITGPLLSGRVDGVGSVAGSPQVSRTLDGQVDGAGAAYGSPVVVADQELVGPVWRLLNPDRSWGLM